MPTEPAWATALFRQTHRLRDTPRNISNPVLDWLRDPECTEIELLPEGFTVEQVLAAADMTWEQCCRVFNDKFVWMAPNVFFSSANFFPSIHAPFVLSVGLETDNHTLEAIMKTGLAARAATTTTFRVYTTEYTIPRDPAVMATCDFLVRLLAAVGRVRQDHHPDDNIFVLSADLNDGVPPPISCAALSHLVQDNDSNTNKSNIRKLKLSRMILNEEHVCALATVSGSMEIILGECRLEDDAECRNAFVQCLVRNRGPTQLYRCGIDYPILTAALTGNSRVTRLKLDRNERNTGHNAADAVAHKGDMLRALLHNCGLVQLDLATHHLDNGHWKTMCESLRMHPTLTDLDLRMTAPLIRASFNRVRLPNEDKVHRTGLLADMIKGNTILHTIRLDSDERDHKIYVNTILPNLEVNLYRSRVLAIKKADSQIRLPLLGRALQTRSVRQKPNLLWMFLSGNPDIGFMKSNDEESGQASTLKKRKANTSVHFPGDKDTYSKRTANTGAARSNRSQSSSPASGNHQIDRFASEKNSRGEIDCMLKRLEANETTISQQNATIKEMQMANYQHFKALNETIDQLTAQVSALATCLNNDPKLLTGVLHSTTSTSKGKRGPEASP